LKEGLLISFLFSQKDSFCPALNGHINKWAYEAQQTE